MKKIFIIFVVLVFSVLFYSCNDFFEDPEPPNIEGIWNYEFTWTSATCNVEPENLLLEGKVEVKQMFYNVTFVFYKTEDLNEYTLIYGNIDMNGNLSLRGIDKVGDEDYYYTLTLSASETFISGDAKIEIRNSQGDTRCTVSGRFIASNKR